MGRFVECGGGSVEKERFFQVRGSPKPEAQKEARDSCPQGSEPLHEGALCVQSQACEQDGACLANEEVQGDGKLGQLRLNRGSLGGRSCQACAACIVVQSAFSVRFPRGRMSTEMSRHELALNFKSRDRCS